MPFYSWDPKLLSVEVKEMDSEHQILIKKMNAVFDGNQAKKSKAELSDLVDDFAKYTIQHFSDEEAFMEQIKFEGIATHKLIHQQLLAEVTKHITEFKTTGVLTQGFFNFLAVWLTSHIRGIDTKYGKVKSKAA